MTSIDAPVDIVSYDSSWPQQFQEEAEVLRHALVPWLAGPIEHIGCTVSIETRTRKENGRSLIASPPLRWFSDTPVVVSRSSILAIASGAVLANIAPAEFTPSAVEILLQFVHE